MAPLQRRKVSSGQLTLRYRAAGQVLDLQQEHLDQRGTDARGRGPVIAPFMNQVLPHALHLGVHREPESRPGRKCRPHAAAAPPGGR